MMALSVCYHRWTIDTIKTNPSRAAFLLHVGVCSFVLPAWYGIRNKRIARISPYTIIRPFSKLSQVLSLHQLNACFHYYCVCVYIYPSSMSTFYILCINLKSKYHFCVRHTVATTPCTHTLTQHEYMKKAAAAAVQVLFNIHPLAPINMVII